MPRRHAAEVFRGGEVIHQNDEIPGVLHALQGPGGLHHRDGALLPHGVDSDVCHIVSSFRRALRRFRFPIVMRREQSGKT